MTSLEVSFLGQILLSVYRHLVLWDFRRSSAVKQNKRITIFIHRCSLSSIHYVCQRRERSLHQHVKCLGQYSHYDSRKDARKNDAGR